MEAMASTTAERASVRARRAGPGVTATDSSYNLAQNAHRKGDRIKKLRSKKFGVNSVELTMLPASTRIGTPNSRRAMASSGKRPHLISGPMFSARDDVR